MQRENRPRKKQNILLWPASCLLQVPPIAILIIFVITAITGAILYTRVNFNFWGLTAVDFSDLEISNDLRSIQSADSQWTLSYEKPAIVEFKGKIRHISPIRVNQFRILSHDVLVTSGDFENPEIVKTSVINHKFTWRTSQEERPSGSINLLHTVPINQEIYNKLWLLNQDDRVVIKGYEILKINVVDFDGTVLRWWEDKGCNTLLVTSIEKRD